MKIVNATIYGFGKWVDAYFDLSSNNESFICFYGENESGKSTFQQFILYVLFGLPPKARQEMQPKQSNKFGGQLTIQDTKLDLLTIERIDGNVRCYLKGGIERDEQWLIEFFGHATRKMMTDVYAFSALDLEEIRQINEKDLSEVLFSVGLSGATDIYFVEKKLKTKTDELFRPQAKVREINIKLNEISEAYTNLQHYLEKEGTYLTLKERQQLVKQKIEQNKALETKHKAGLALFHRIEQYLPQIEEHRLKKEQWERYPKDLSFPENGKARYEMVKKELLPLKAKLNSLEESETTLRHQHESILKQLYPQDVYEDIYLILGDKQTFEQLKMMIRQKEEQILSIEDEISVITQQLAIHPELIEQHSLPFQLEAEWKEFVEEHQEIEIEKSRVLDGESRLNLDQRQIEEEKIQISVQMIDDEQINQMQFKIDQYQQESQVDSKQNKRRDELKGMIAKRQRMSTFIFSSILIILIGIMIIAFVIGSMIWKIAMSSLLLLNLIIWFSFRQSTSSINKFLQNETMTQSFSLDEAEYHQLQQQIQTQHNLNITYKALEREQNRLKNDKILLKEQWLLLNQREKEWQRKREQMDLQYPFLQQVSVKRWIDLLKKIQQVKSNQANLAKILQQKSDLQNELEKIVEKLQLLAEKIDWQYDRLTFEHIDKIIVDYRKNNEMLKDYQHQLEENRAEQQLIKESIAIQKDEILKLFSFSQVDNEEDFYKVEREIVEKQSLQQLIESFDIQLSNLFSESIKEKLLSQEWDGQKIQFEIATLHQKLSELEDNQHDLNQQLVTLEFEISELEQSEQFSQASFTFQMKKDELNDLAYQWAINQVALSALQQTKKQYQEKHLEEIMEQTSLLFKKMTNGVYIDVYPPINKRAFQVEKFDHTRYFVEELSQGTVNQLYVALRLAIGVVMGEKVNFPFIIDDAFVHFDANRTSQMIDILKQISEKTQVILFTCKKDIASLASAKSLPQESEIIEIT